MLSKTAIWNCNDVIPPKLFDCVSPGVYRSNRFSKENFPFIEAIGFKYIVYIGNNDVGNEIENFAQDHSITLVFVLAYSLQSRYPYMTYILS